MVAPRTFCTAIFAATGSLAIAACSPGGKAGDPATTAEATSEATTPSAAPAEPAAVVAAPAGLFDGIAGVDRVPAGLLPQMATDTAPHWTRCGAEMVTEVMSADGKPEGFVIARGLSFAFVDAAIDVPSQKVGVTSRRGINLRSDTHARYFGEGVSHTDISGRTVTRAGWGAEVRLTAPLPHWRADEVNGAWQATFRPNATDGATWPQRYRAADCASLPPQT